MPKGVPNKGFRVTKNRIQAGWTPPSGGVVLPFSGSSAMLQRDQMLENLGRAAPLDDTLGDAETEAVRRERISERFEVLKLMTEATARGQARSLIISGPPGVGKSYDLESVMKDMEEYNIVSESIKGFVRATGLYKAFYKNRHANCVTIFDDADSVFFDDVSLNILKTACDTTKKRVLSWRAETKMISEDGEEAIPTSFEFYGSVIYITNMDFDVLIAKGTKLAPHFEALISRSHYLDLTLRTKRDYMTRILQVIDTGMLDNLGVTGTDKILVIDFMEQNIDNLREISLRMVVKLTDLIKSHRGYWKKIAAATCLRQR